MIEVNKQYEKPRRQRSTYAEACAWHDWSRQWVMAHTTDPRVAERIRAEMDAASLYDLKCAMSHSERQVYAKLPRVLTVYRGIAPPGRGAEGLSWTLNKDIARFFAGGYSTRFTSDRGLPPGAAVLTGRTRKAGCIFLSGRGEDEIVAPHVTVVSSEPATRWNGAPPAALYPLDGAH